jgi:hypothetical protein
VRLPGGWTGVLFGVLFGVLLLFVAACQPLEGQGRTLEVEDFEAELTVTPSGTLHVLERIRFRFQGSWNGVLRNIPVRYDDGRGFDYRLRLDLESATLGDGTELRVEESRGGGEVEFKIWVPDATDVVRTVEIRYRVANGLRFFETHDELYWNVTGVDWDVPLGPASARVILPNGVSGLRTRSFVGAYGSTQEAPEPGITSSIVAFESGEALGFRRGLTVVVGWDAGVVHRPTGMEKARDFGRANGILLLPFVVLFGVWRRWRSRGKDPEQRAVVPRYAPPEGLTPGEAGTLVDNRPDVRDVTATVVDLAIRGFLRIEEEEVGSISRFFGGRSFAFQRLRSEGSWGDLQPHESEVLRGLFPAGDSRVTTEDLENRFYRELPGIRSALFDALVGHGFYARRPDRVVGRWVGGGVVVGALGVPVMLWAAQRFSFSPLAGAIAAVASGLVIILFGAFMSARTVPGVRKLEEILGLQEFLERVDKDRFRVMIKSPEDFEALLPYAMALGVERRWAEAFDGLYTEPPDWYVGNWSGNGFRPSTLTSHMGDLSKHTGSAMTTAPRSSSSSSGFGGGGFSGGGGGGGGGGGF